MRKWFLAAAVLLVMVVAVILPTAAADLEPTFAIQVPTEAISAGNDFTVTIALRGNPGFCALEFHAAYDTSLMECTQLQAGALTEGMLLATNPAASDGAIFVGAVVSPVTGDGTVAVLSFRAKKDISAVELELRDLMLADEDGKELSTVTVTEQQTAGSTDTEDKTEDKTEDTKEPENTGETEEPEASEAPEEPADTEGPEDTEEPETPEEPSDTEEPQEPEEPADTETAAITFTDTAGHWAEAYIAKAAELGIFKGNEDGTFAPEASITRAQFLTVLYRMSGSPTVDTTTPFGDISDQIPEFQSAIAWGYANGYVNGKSERVFDPNGKITRQEALKILYYYAGGKSGMEQMFTAIYDANYTDSSQVASWAKAPMYWGVYNEIISGTSAATLSPEGTATRAQVAKILVNYLEKFAS